MKRFTTILLLGLAALILGACDGPKAKSVADISQQLTEQFRAQHEGSPSAPRKLKNVEVKSFETPSGNPRAYLGISVAWEDTTTSTSVALIQLGDGLYGVTYTDPKSQEELSAVLSFR